MLVNMDELEFDRELVGVNCPTDGVYIGASNRYDISARVLGKSYKRAQHLPCPLGFVLARRSTCGRKSGV